MGHLRLLCTHLDFGKCSFDTRYGFKVLRNHKMWLRNSHLPNSSSLFPVLDNVIFAVGTGVATADEALFGIALGQNERILGILLAIQ